ncbi:hypothetical protein HY633_02310, partial [Candidatus Uhrbacteria bacterium]|nr:hypothetical protein [Candidatus Uhrbacteria bacterium]
NIKISFYTASSGGSPVHTDCGTTGTPVGRKVVFTSGVGSVLIGDPNASGTTNCADASTPNALPTTLFDNTNLFLGITVDPDVAEMTPRKRLAATAWAINSDRMSVVAGPADPTGVAGMIVYNTSLAKFRCFEGVAWTDCVTAAAAAGGWADDGTTVRLITASDNVGIGTGSPTAKLHVSGTVIANGGQMDLNTSGSGVTNIGTGSSTGALAIGNSGNTLSIGTSLLSTLTNSLNLGSDAANFATLFLGANGIVFEGGTNNGFETTLNAADPTADRVINFPNASGNVLLDTNTALFTLSGTSGSSQSIGFGDALMIAAGTNITTTGSATDTVTVGIVASPTFTSVITPSYTGVGAVSLTSGGTADLTLDTSSSSGSILIGTGTAGALTIGRSSVTTTVNGTLTANTFTSTGVSITGGTINGTTIGASTPSTGAFTTLTTTGNVIFGDAATDRLTLTGELLLGAIAADPAGTNGLTYYNSSSNKFRCYENGAWIDCVAGGATGGGWTDDGTIVRLTTGTDQVRINTSAAGNGQPLEVNGVIRSVTGGFQFPDGTTQTTAAATSAGVSSTGDVNVASNTDNSAGGDIIFATSTVERARINSAGTFTVGTLSASGLISGSAGLTISGGAINFSTTGTPAINIGTSTSYNGAMTIGNTDGGDGGTPTIIITSPGWTIDTVGNMSGIGTISSDGLATLNAGLTVNTGAVNLAPNGTAVLNIGSNTNYNGAMTIGNTDGGDGGTPTIIITSPGWTIDTVGNMSGIGTISSDGLATLNAGLTINNGATNIATTGTNAINIGTNTNFNGIISIGNNDGGDGGNASVNITSQGNWSIANGGAFNTVSTITSSGLITGGNGLTINTGAVNLLPNSTAAINVGSNTNYNGAITIGNADGGDGGTPTVAITSPGWSIGTSGTFSNTAGATMTSSGRITGTGGLTVSGNTISLNDSTNSAVTICTLDGCNATISIGNNNTGDGGTPSVNITSNGSWSITNGGTFNTVSTITSSGLITGNNGLTSNTGAVNLLPNSTAAINVGSNTNYNGLVTIGNTDGGDGGTPTIIVTSPGWTIDTAGNASG